MADPLQAYLRSGYPKENLSESSYSNALEYVGPKTALEGKVFLGDRWGDYPGFVSGADAEPIEGTNPQYVILRVTVQTKEGSADYPSDAVGQLDEQSDERDWVSVQRSMWEHPEFRVDGGGTYQLTSGDVEEIGAWIQEEDVDKKAAYEYKPKGLQDGVAYYRTLSANGIKFAKGIQFGIEYYNDFAPVVRRQSTYVGGPPPEGSAGEKEDPPAELAIPDYEYIKNADRALKSGGQTRWRRDQEWLGAKAWLVDRNKIYW